IRQWKPKGIILSGGPNSVYGDNVPTAEPALLELGTPVLGLCYGMQLLAHLSGGKVERAARREYGRAMIEIKGGKMFHGFGQGEETPVWMSHGDHVDTAPPGYRVTASSANAPVAGFEHTSKALYGVQFHPAVERTPPHFPLRGRRLGSGLDSGKLHRQRDCPNPRAGEAGGAGDLRIVRRRGFVGRRGAGPSRGRRPAHLYLRRPWPASVARPRSGRAHLPPAPGDRSLSGRRWSQVPRRPRRRHRSGAQAEEDWSPVHRYFRSRGAKGRVRCRLPGAGDAISRRHRIHVTDGWSFGTSQAPL